MPQSLNKPTDTGHLSEQIISISLFASKKRNLIEQNIVNGIFKNQEYLKTLGIYPKNKHGQFMDTSEIVTFISGLVHNWKKAEKQILQEGHPKNIYKNEQYQELVYWLNIINQVVPILATDWKVDRLEAADQCLGIDRFKLEEVLAQKYPFSEHDNDPVFRTVEVGAGSGEVIHDRRIKNLARSPEQRFEQFGIGDKIYFPIEKVLHQFLQPQFQENPAIQKFLNFIDIALRQELKSRWFEAEGNVIRKWIPKVQFFDLNLVYELLGNPRPWLEKWYSPHTGKYKLSQEFENDGEAVLDKDLHRLFLDFSGYSPQEIETILSDKVKSPNNARALLVEYLEICRVAIPESMLAREIPSRIKQIKYLLKGSNIHSSFLRNIPIPETVEQFYQYINQLLDKLTTKESRQQPSRKKPSGDHAAVTDFKKKIFTNEFAEGISNPQKRIDLNKFPPVYLHNFFIDTFNNLPQHFPEQSIMLDSSARSDSHASNADFEKLIEARLKLLKPGGVLATDGIRASYSRIYRLPEIQAIASRLNPDPTNPEFKIEIILEKLTQTPVSLFIQRKHPQGFLNNQEKAKFAETGSTFADLNFVADRQDLQVLNEVRQKMLQLAGDIPTCFKAIQHRVEDRVIGILGHAALKEASALPPSEIQNLAGASHYEQQMYSYSLLRENKIRLTTRDQLSRTLQVISEMSEIIRGNSVQTQFEHLRFLEPGYIYTLPETETSETPDKLNLPHKFPAHRLPDNEEFNDPETQLFLEQQLTKLRNKIAELESRGIMNPVRVLSFADCITNQLLVKKIEKLLDKKIPVISIESAQSENGYSVITNKELVNQQLSEFIDQGGVLIPGGSWLDSHMEKPIQEILASRFLNAVLDPAKRFRMFTICFSTQIFANLLGRKFYNNRLQTYKGSLMVGPEPFSIRANNWDHPWFEKFPLNTTFAGTHSGHIYDTVSEKERADWDPLYKFTPLATSGITGLPLAWEGCSGRVLSTLIHPEVDLIEQQKLSADVTTVNQKIADAFDRQKSRFSDHNWRQIYNDEKKPYIKANAGDLLLVNGLLHLLKDL